VTIEHYCFLALRVEKRWGAPNISDLNQVDYSIWGALKQFVHCPRRTRDVAHLKEVLKNLLGADWSRRYWSRYRTVSQTIVTRCCNRWRT